MKKNGLVYSTNPNLDLNQFEDEFENTKNEFTVSVCYERKGRKGKGVTIIKGLLIHPIELATLSKKIKTSLGLGGSIKNHEIIIQGKVQEKIINILKNAGYKVKKVGG